MQIIIIDKKFNSITDPLKILLVWPESISNVGFLRDPSWRLAVPWSLVWEYAPAVDCDRRSPLHSSCDQCSLHWMYWNLPHLKANQSFWIETWNLGDFGYLMAKEVRVEMFQERWNPATVVGWMSVCANTATIGKLPWSSSACWYRTLSFEVECRLIRNRDGGSR